jgi:hypothetical protein
MKFDVYDRDRNLYRSVDHDFIVRTANPIIGPNITIGKHSSGEILPLDDNERCLVHRMGWLVNDSEARSRIRQLQVDAANQAAIAGDLARFDELAGKKIYPSEFAIHEMWREYSTSGLRDAETNQNRLLILERCLLLKIITFKRLVEFLAPEEI